MNLRFTAMCDITRNPVAGQTGLTTVAECVPCTHVYPANERNWMANFGTDLVGHELYLATEAVIKVEDILTTDNKSYTIKKANKWPALMSSDLPKHQLYLEERRR